MLKVHFKVVVQAGSVALAGAAASALFLVIGFSIWYLKTDKVLKSKGNARGSTLVMALQDLCYGFVCSQNLRAAQTLGDLYQTHCLGFWLMSSFAQKALPVAEPDLAWYRTGSCVIQPFPSPVQLCTLCHILFSFHQVPKHNLGMSWRAKLCLSNATEHQLPLFVLKYQDTPPLCTFWKNLGGLSLCLGMARPWDMHTPCRLEESQTG